MNIVILAGGSGTRLWPMSRQKKAKQFNAIINHKTMLENTIERFSGSYPARNIFISTNKENLDNVLMLLPDFPRENIIIEPEKRDTAAAMGYVCAVMSLKAPDEPLAFIASDHYIMDKERFLATLAVAEEKIKKTKKLVDIGITPESPSTALGYTHIGKKLDKNNGVEVYEFLGHTEKPKHKIAQEYVKSGNYLWHGNFYMWTPRLFLSAFKKYAPEIYGPLKIIAGLLKKGGDEQAIAKTYKKIPKVMIDYALTEKMSPKDILIIRGDFGWSDIGSWDVLHKKLSVSADEQGNLVKGKWMGIDTSQSIVYSCCDKLVATIGVGDLVVIDTEDVLLVCPKGRSQDVKKMVEMLKEQKKYNKYL